MGSRNEWSAFGAALVAAVAVFALLPTDESLVSLPVVALVGVVALFDASIPSRNVSSVAAAVGLPAMVIANPLAVLVVVLVVSALPVSLFARHEGLADMRFPQLASAGVVCAASGALWGLGNLGLSPLVSVVVAEVCVFVVGVVGVVRQSSEGSLGLVDEERRLRQAGVLAATAYGCIGALAVVLFGFMNYWALLVTVGLYFLIRQSAGLSAQVTEAHLDLAAALAHAVDEAIGLPEHSGRVSSLSAKIARALGLKTPLVKRIQLAALLHDLDRIAQEDTDNDLVAAILQSSGFLAAVAPIVSACAGKPPDAGQEETRIAAYVIGRASNIDETLSRSEGIRHVVPEEYLDSLLPLDRRRTVELTLREAMTGV